jgi:hypothetical protein
MAGSESECTSEMGRGQFSIFGAVEEMVFTDFGGLAGFGILSCEHRQAAARAGVGGLEKIEVKAGKVWAADCAQRVHRKCRKGVVVEGAKWCCDLVDHQ